MDGSILSSIGIEIIGVMSPVSLCMLLVVLLVYALSAPSSSLLGAPIRTAANLVYLENPSDSATQKLEGSLLNALVFVILVALVTFLLFLLYYYNFTNFLKNYMRFSAFFVLGSMGGAIFLSVIQHYSIPIDSITCSVLLFNFTVVGVISVFGGGVPIFLRQVYMVLLAIIVAAWFTKLPEWTTWSLLVGLAVYDLVAVLAPGGPLKILVELAMSRGEDLPGLVYEARPTVSRDSQARGAVMGPLVFGVSDSGSVELQQVSRNSEDRNEIAVAVGTRNTSHQTAVVVEAEVGNDQTDDSESVRDEDETSPLVGNLWERHSSSGSSEYSTVVVPANPGRGTGGRNSEIVVDEETSPLVEMLGVGDQREHNRRDGLETSMTAGRGIKLGLGDFVFYSVLVGRAAMYDLMTVYACYLAIISGLGCTLILLSVHRQALPALPISITLGIAFYFLTRLLMEPFVVGASTNLMMF
ncbi:presenilin-like protein At1g08700 [Malania oleifera]|uniref:presenilin-like protein At1g08700 n=1 Tax=Malania oleifera TaxID=397392 RepID=UPI0025AE9B51|nr:presenilin-like protein At1g08700 [Malania oleifera]